MQVEQNEKLITALLKISDDEKDMEEVEKGLSLPPHRYDNLALSLDRIIT